MDDALTTTIQALAQATTEGWPCDWREELRTAANSICADWALSKRDVAVSRVEDCVPGEKELVKWIRAYARHGSPIDPIRVRIWRNGQDLHSYLVHVPEEIETTTQDRALAMALQVLGDPNMRAGILNTLTIALKPIAETLIRPVVVSSLQEILDDSDTEPVNPCIPSPQATSTPTIPISTQLPDKASA